MDGGGRENGGGGWGAAVSAVLLFVTFSIAVGSGYRGMSALSPFHSADEEWCRFALRFHNFRRLAMTASLAGYSCPPPRMARSRVVAYKGCASGPQDLQPVNYKCSHSDFGTSP